MTEKGKKKEQKKQKYRGGRKGKFAEWLTPEGLTKLEGWARDGLTDPQIAKNIGIHVATLYDWRNRFSEIDEAVKKGKEVIDFEVENALLKRALGYEYEEEKKTMEYINGEQKQKIEKTKKHVAGDTTAMIFWLKNRKPVEWRDRREMQIQHDKNEVADEIDEFLNGMNDDEEE